MRLFFPVLNSFICNDNPLYISLSLAENRCCSCAICLTSRVISAFKPRRDWKVSDCKQ